MKDNRVGNWQTRLLQPRWGRTELRPADVSAGLEQALLSREAILEDANYQKVVPNHFIVEISPERYAAEYQPIEKRVIQQWSERLLEHLMTVNSRLGRREYILGGRLRIEIRPADNLNEPQFDTPSLNDLPGKSPQGGATPSRSPSGRGQFVRIHYRIEPSVETDPRAHSVPACLERVPSGQRIPLRGDLLSKSPFTLGRDPGCSLAFDDPAVLEKRLVSSVHATIRSNGTEFFLYDGAPDGRSSLNGTYLNGRRLAAGEGAPLAAGDTIQLAAVDTELPRPDTPGVVVIRFQRQC